MRGVFSAPTFAVFVALVTGLLGGSGRRTVTGMWIAAGLAGVAHHGRAHWFFSHARWDLDALGLLLARAVLAALAPGTQPVTVAVDDTLFHRYGRRVFGCFWQHDGSAVSPTAVGRGNCFVIAGIVTMVAGMSRPVFLPILFRLSQPGKGPTKPQLARQMVAVLTLALQPRGIHVVADAAYRSPTWRSLPATVSFTTRLPCTAVLYAPPPPRTGRRGRPPAKGARLGTPADLAATACWRPATVTRYGATLTVHLATVACLWHGSLGTTPVQVILVRESASNTRLDIALITTDVQATAVDVVCRYAARWSIEQAIKDGKDLIGAGEAQNRLPAAVHRSAPFALLCQSILVLWYQQAGDHQGDLAARRAAAPWFRHKTHISLQDMLIAFRRARITPAMPAQDTTSQIIATPTTSTPTAA
jgi:SRSO17 transposase